MRQQAYIGIFYKGGLRLFAETGFIYDLLQNVSIAAPPDIRKTVLNRLYQDCAESGKLLRIAKPQRLHLPQDVVIAVREYVGTHFTLPLEISGEYCNVQIEEGTITEAFLDFITAVAESDSVYTKGITLDKIHQAMGIHSPIV